MKRDVIRSFLVRLREKVVVLIRVDEVAEGILKKVVTSYCHLWKLRGRIVNNGKIGVFVERQELLREGLLALLAREAGVEVMGN